MQQKPAANNATLILELGDRVLRSWWTVVAGACIGLACGVIALQHMPKVYEATTRIWISQQEISESVVRSTVKDDMALKLAAFRDAVLADEYMIELIKHTFGVPETDEELNASMAQVRGNVTIDTVNASRKGVQAFRLGYRDTDPQRAANVINTLSQLYVAQNTAFRMDSAVKVEGAIQKMASSAKSEFDIIDGELTRFKQRHQFETEEHLSANLQLLESRKRDVAALQARRDLVRRDLRLADEELAQARSQAALEMGSNSGTIVIDPLSQQIAATKRELEELRVRYAESYPDVKRKRVQLEELLAQARNRVQNEQPDNDVNSMALSSNPVIASIQKRIQESNNQLAKMDSDEGLLRREIAEYERRIQVEPEVQRQLTELDEEHAVAREKWRKLERDVEDARGGIELEESSMAEGMEILTMAGVPRSPIEPNPRQIYLMFLGVGMAIFVGPMLARHVLNPPITSEAGLRSLTTIPVLVSVPRIMTPDNRGAGRRNLIKNLAFSVLACAVLVTVKWFVQGG